MMISLSTYVRQSRHTLRKVALDPRLHWFLRVAGHFLAGFLLSAASLGNRAMPLAMGLVIAQTGWQGVLTATGGVCGYLLFWGKEGHQGLLWMGAALAATLIPGQRQDRPLRRLLPAVAALIVAASGVVFQIWLADTTSVPVYILRVLMGTGASALFLRVTRERSPVLDWFTCAVAVLALAQVLPLPGLGLGFFAAGALTAAAPFPAVVLSGMALDLAQVTELPMAAILCCGFLIRFLGSCPRWIRCIAPAAAAAVVMALLGRWDLWVLPGLLAGGTAGALYPAPGKVAYRRGETGAAQVRLEITASVLAQMEQLLLEVQPMPVDADALVSRSAERACAGCPCRKNCADIQKIRFLPGLLLQKPLLTPEELPVICRKSGRFLAELHRSQEQFRAIRADRQRQREYRQALVQQYRFLAEYLQQLSDRLAQRVDTVTAAYAPEVQIYGNRPPGENGDRCFTFTGTRCRSYALLCDGMGTGLGAAQEAKTAGNMLRRLLSVGFPTAYALRSINSLCALRERAGAVTVDLAEIELDTGCVTVYKWGAAPSWLISAHGKEKLGTPGPPPGLSVEGCRESVQRVSLRRGETLLLVSDGIPETALQQLKQEDPPGALARTLLRSENTHRQDDATVVTIRLQPK